MTDEAKSVFDEPVETASEEKEEQTQEAEETTDDSEAKADESTEESTDTEGDGEAQKAAGEEDSEEVTSVPLPAYERERARRQEAEAELSKIRAEQLPSADKDPEGYARMMKLEMSRDIMRETHSDYDEKILRFQELAKANPDLEVLAANHKNPAKFAYDLVKEEEEISKLQELSKSDDWKEFQKWKKTQPKSVKTDVKAALSVPKLNQATSVKSTAKANNEDIFAGSAF